MATRQVRSALGQLQRLLAPAGASTLSDSQLLDDFVTRRDERAFEVLVWRHASLVLGTCERILRDSHAAEDAFQATYLVFARKAASIGKRESVAGWLYKVASRIAMRAQAKRRVDVPFVDAAAADSPDEAEWRELRPVLDEEIGRLPEKYRLPFVLCYLEGQTNEAAAEQLGCPKGTVLSRLSRGRDWLRARLLRRGIALSAGAFASLSSRSASAASPSLVASTTAAAIPFACGDPPAGLLSPAVVTLSEGALRAMTLSKVKFAAAVLLLAALGSGAGVLGSRAFAIGPASVDVAVAEPESAAVPDFEALFFAAADEPRDREQPRERNDQAPDITGRVVSVNKEGTAFSVETPPKERGGEPGKLEVKIGAKTAITYHGVGPNGAKPTEGYQARVNFDESKTTAATIAFTGAEAGRGAAGIYGIVRSLAKEGDRVMIETRVRGRDIDAKTIDIAFDSRTVIVFSGVPRDGAKIAEGQAAMVQLVDSTKNNTAGIITFSPVDGRREFRRDRRPDILGKLVSGDDKSLTIEQFAGRGEEPTKVTVKLSEKSSVTYFNVVVGAAKPAEGMQVQIWLEEGSKDTAAQAMLHAAPPERWTTVSGKLASASADGGTVTIEQPTTMRGEEPRQVTIKLTDKSKVVYRNVGPNEAKPTVGYQVTVRLLDGTKDVAAEAQFAKPVEGGRR